MPGEDVALSTMYSEDADCRDPKRQLLAIGTVLRVDG